MVFKNLLFSLLLLGFIACGAELPVTELASAKSEIARAKKYNAQELAPDELKEAEKSLFAAHEAASSENISSTKKNAEYSWAKALDATEKSLPKATNAKRDEATASIDKADESYATVLATEEFDKAVAYRKEGDVLYGDANRPMQAYIQESSDEVKKAELRRQAFQNYEASHAKYTDAVLQANRATEIAIARRDDIKASGRDIEQDLATADKYSDGKNPAVSAEKENVAKAYALIDSGKVKEGATLLESSRKNAKSLLANSTAGYARSLNTQATDEVNKANDSLSGINSSKLKKGSDSFKRFESSREVLGAANEALASSGSLLSQERYTDSIRQSEEAIRLAAIVREQSTILASKEPAKTSEELSSKTASVENEGSSVDSETSGNGDMTDAKDSAIYKTKKYTVQRKTPADCLWRIAAMKQHYNNYKLWPNIYKANKNKIRNPNLIYPSQVLTVPKLK